MNVATRLLFVPILAFGLALAGCGGSGGSGDSGDSGNAGGSGDEVTGDATTDAGDTGHDGDHDHPHEAGDEGHGSGHDEVSLGTTTIGEMEVQCWQGHGALAAGAEGHLVVKLPYDDDGATRVRAWIGTEDRLQSMVGLGAYAPGDDDYDVHAEAPDPLPGNAMWWVEVTMPDGTKAVGSIAPRR